jgi:hypothetical protein
MSKAKEMIEPGRPGDLLTIFETAVELLQEMKTETQKMEGAKIGDGEGEMSVKEVVALVTQDHEQCVVIATNIIETLFVWLGIGEAIEAAKEKEVTH